MHNPGNYPRDYSRSNGNKARALSRKADRRAKKRSPLSRASPSRQRSTRSARAPDQTARLSATLARARPYLVFQTGKGQTMAK